MSSTKHPELVALLDCNNFYVSCERVFNPKLLHIPVVVLSNNDGCVIARSNEAKELGIAMGVPYYQCRDLIRKHHVAVCSSNYTLYGDMSARVIQILYDECPAVHVYSIDESFIDFAIPKPESFSRHLVDKIKRELGLPVSIGIGPTKTLAKVANKLAKSRENIFIIGDNREIVLKEFPISKIWGIGRRLTSRLEAYGIQTAWDLSLAEEGWVRKELSVVGLRTVLELRGIPSISMDEVPQPKQSLCTSKSFSHPVTQLEELHEALMVYTARAGEKLRKQKSLASHIAVFVVPHNPYNGGSQVHYQADLPLTEPTYYTPHLLHYAKQALKKLWSKNTAYRKIGVILSGIVPDSQFQSDFISGSKLSFEKQQKLMELMDALNQKAGKKLVKMASEVGKHEWQMQREHLSPRYTTQWPEILKVKI